MSKISDLLLEEHSKSQILLIVQQIEASPSLEAELLDAFLSSNNVLAQRAAWVLFHYFKSRPEQFLVYLEKCLPILQSPLHPAQLRNMLNILQYVDVPKEWEAFIYDQCLRLTSDSCQPTAIRVFALQVATNIALAYPEFSMEIKSLIPELEIQSAGFKNRWKKLRPLLNSAISGEPDDE